MSKYYTIKELETAEKKRTALIKARNNACAAINDAQARYIKKKTGAKSRKLAMEKDAILSNPKYQKLDLYDKRDDIQEAFGFDVITEKERDRLEELWDEREEIRKKTVDGVYTDKVTEALNEAYTFVSALWEEDVSEYDQILKEGNQQIEEMKAAAEEFERKVEEDYKKFVMGK